MAACDPVLVDAYVCRLQHYEVDEVPYVRLAEALGVGSADLSGAEIITRGKIADRELSDETVQDTFRTDDRADKADGGQDASWQSCAEDEDLPRARKIVELSDSVEEIESCSACYGYLMPALDRLKSEGLLDLLDTKICIGQGYQGKTGKIGIGRCTGGFEHNVRGCPPTEQQIYEFLRDYLTGKSKAAGE